MNYGILRDRGSFDQNSLDQNCVLSVDQNFHNQLTKIFETFHLIKIFNNEFDQMPKNQSVDQKIRSTNKKELTDFGS
jgi:hypothetical protein